MKMRYIWDLNRCVNFSLPRAVHKTSTRTPTRKRPISDSTWWSACVKARLMTLKTSLSKPSHTINSHSSWTIGCISTVYFKRRQRTRRQEPRPGCIYFIKYQKWRKMSNQMCLKRSCVRLWQLRWMLETYAMCSWFWPTCGKLKSTGDLLLDPKK